MKIVLHNIEMHLLPEKALFLAPSRMLCIADWHLGKSAHFRKHGIPLPQPGADKGFDILEELIGRFMPHTVAFLGDLFHSAGNNEWLSLHSFICRYPDIRFLLVKGNHDILPETYYGQAGIETVNELLIGDKIIFTHEPLYNDTPVTCLNIAGHVHPGCIIEQKARQTFRLPCFYYRSRSLLLPAFGTLTGLHVLHRRADDRVFCIVNDEILKV